MATSGLSVFVERVARLMDGEAVAHEATDVRLPDLVDQFAQVGDGRSDVGRDHPVAAVLALAAGAVVAGMRLFTAIAGWVADAPAHLLATVYGRVQRTAARSPSKTTIWRVVCGADPEAVDSAVGGWLGDRDDDDDEALSAVAVDGKTVRGAKTAEQPAPHLLAAATHDGVVLAQAEVGAKTNEIPCFIPLLEKLNVEGRVVTADALHTQRGHARWLVGHGADFVFCVKGNQPNLYAVLDALPWSTVPVEHTDVTVGHGRTATRTISTLPAPPDLPFPHVNQVFLIERHVVAASGRTLSHLGVLGVTSLAPDRADAEAVAGLVRGQWGIEGIHFTRTRCSPKTPPACAADPDHASWHPCATSPSGHSTRPDATTPPKPPAGPPAAPNAPSRSSDSHDQKSWNGRGPSWTPRTMVPRAGGRLRHTCRMVV